jgi:hypothetical protein
MFARLLLIGSLLAVASPAFANTNVVVLGLRSIEGDDDVANDMTEQLRGAARAIQGWSISNAAVSMAQMSLAHGCDELDAACLSDIAKGLQADKIIYGTLRRTTARTDFDFALTLSLFDAASGAIVRQVDDTIPHAQTEFQALAARADKLVARLSATSTGGAIEIQANVPDAEVNVNGQMVGTTRDGALRLEGLQPGSYRIEIHKDGYGPHVSTVAVTEGAETAITAVLSSIGATESLRVETETETGTEHHQAHLGWLGWTLIGVGGAALIGSGASAMVVHGVNGNSLYNKYRDAVARGNKMAVASGLTDQVVNDVCQAADHGYVYDLMPSELTKVQGKCHAASTFQVLQWVLLGTGIVSAGVGTYLLITQSGSKHERADEAERSAASRPRLALQPSFGPRSAHLSATLTF